jgi:hypothetical protein
MSEHVGQGRPELFHDLNLRDVAEGVESQLATSSLALAPDQLPNAPDSNFTTTQEFWRAVLFEEVRAC